MTTFQVGGAARWFAEATTEQEVMDAVEYARQNNLRLFVLGGGSNLVVADSGWPGMVLKIALRGVQESQQDGLRHFDAGAGEDWDSLVALAVSRDCGGIEAMSGIPGTVGGTPVQNVGAYGQEVSETIVNVRVLDLFSMKVQDLRNQECGFAYRTSIFNSFEVGCNIVLRVTYALRPGASPHIEYADLKKFFAVAGGAPTLQQTRDAVRQIRLSKAMLIVPNDDDCRSAGSFFKNPILTPEQAGAVTAKAAALGLTAPPQYPAPEGKAKLSAGWMVENSGFAKGYARGRVAISRKHALAIVNRGGARAADIMALKDEVQRGVKETFGVELAPEPVFVGFFDR